MRKVTHIGMRAPDVFSRRCFCVFIQGLSHSVQLKDSETRIELFLLQTPNFLLIPQERKWKGRIKLLKVFKHVVFQLFPVLYFQPYLVPSFAKEKETIIQNDSQKIENLHPRWFLKMILPPKYWCAVCTCIVSRLMLLLDLVSGFVIFFLKNVDSV